MTRQGGEHARSFEKSPRLTDERSCALRSPGSDGTCALRSPGSDGTFAHERLTSQTPSAGRVLAQAATLSVANFPSVRVSETSAGTLKQLADKLMCDLL